MGASSESDDGFLFGLATPGGVVGFIVVASVIVMLAFVLCFKCGPCSKGWRDPDSVAKRKLAESGFGADDEVPMDEEKGGSSGASSATSTSSSGSTYTSTTSS